MRYFLMFFCFLATYAHAQNEYVKHDRVWVLGGDIDGTSQLPYGNVDMVFDSSTCVLTRFNRKVVTDFGTTSICNRQGQLQFITNGFTVWNSNRDTLLHPINTADYNYPNNVQYNMGQRIAKANVFLEDPADSNWYYLR
jgi:hypothetical protein